MKAGLFTPQRKTEAQREDFSWSYRMRMEPVIEHLHGRDDVCVFSGACAQTHHCCEYHPHLMPSDLNPVP